MDYPVQKPKRFFSPIWILPIVALCIGGWLLYSSIKEAGVEITVHFQDAKGITQGKTKVIFKGLPIGTVKDIEVDEDMNGVNIVIEMENRAKPLLVEDTAFWVVKPEVSAGRISGLDTLLGGSYIGTQKGKSTESATHFEGLKEAPPLDPTTPGLRFTLEAENLFSLQRGSNIYSQNLQIGHIEDYELQDNGKILFQAYVQPEFSHLIKKETRFWNASGLSLTGNLQQGLSVNIESLASLVYGGITCQTPKTLETTTPAQSGETFTLYRDFEDAEYGIGMRLQLTTGEGIIAGKTRVMFRGLKVGVVRDVTLNNDNFHTVTAQILLDPRAEPILRDTTRFWVIKPEVGLSGVHNIETLLGGIYITFNIGEGEYRDHFVEAPGPMPKPPTRTGKTFHLQTEDSGSLTTGAPVLYKRLQVGEVSKITLAPSGETVTLDLLVYDEYTHLVHTDSVFWNVSGINIGGSLSNIKINLASLQAMLTGGIAFFNPIPGSTTERQAQEGQSFTLYQDMGEAYNAEEVIRSQGLIIQVAATAMPAMSNGSPLLYNNVKIGKVLSFELDGAKQNVIIQVLVEHPYTDLITTSSRFYNASGFTLDASLDGIQLETGSLDAIVSGGLSLINLEQGSPVENFHQFSLFASKKDAERAMDLDLTLHLAQGSGIKPGTKITYRGIGIGEIDTIHLNQDATSVVAQAFIGPEAATLFRKSSRLWLIRHHISLTGVEHLNTLLTGPYIEVTRGEGPITKEFTVEERPKHLVQPNTGLNLILETPHLGSISIGSPIAYRQVQVGRVTGYELSPTNQQVWVSVNIEPSFAQLVYQGSQFWNASGVTVTGGVLSGLSVSTESMEALLKGGIAFATPDGEAMGRPAQNGDHFLIAAKAEDKWLGWQPVLPPDPQAQPVTAPPEPSLGQEDKINE